MAVQAERDANNNAQGEMAPPVMPRPLATMRTSTFIENILDRYWHQLQQEWNEEEIEMIEWDHQELAHSFQSEVRFKERIQKQSHSTMVNSEWDVFAGCFVQAWVAYSPTQQLLNRIFQCSSGKWMIFVAPCLV